MDESSVERFAILDLESVFQRLADENWQGILIGGQAVNLYAQHYEHDIANIQSLMPLASRDLDFHGGPSEARRAMQILNATGRINDGTDFSPNAGVLKVRLATEQILIIDILTSVFGVSASEMLRSSITWSLNDRIEIEVIHPLLLLESKLACLRGLDQRGRQDGKHVELLISVIASWLREQLESPRDVFKAIERLAGMMMTPDGLAAYQRNIELWDSIPIVEMRSRVEYACLLYTSPSPRD